jgi:hypothetical protein
MEGQNKRENASYIAEIVVELEASAQKADEQATFWRGRADELHNQVAVLRDLHIAGLGYRKQEIEREELAYGTGTTLESRAGAVTRP